MDKQLAHEIGQLLSLQAEIEELEQKIVPNSTAGFLD